MNAHSHNFTTSFGVTECRTCEGKGSDTTPPYWVNDVLWEARLELSDGSFATHQFWFDRDADPRQANYRAWEIWSLARNPMTDSPSLRTGFAGCFIVGEQS